MNIFVGGVNGVGKSTILRRLTQIDHRFEVIHMTSALMQELGLGHGDYDALHAVPNKVRDAAMAKIIAGLVERSTTKLRLLDSHYLNLVWGQVHDVTREWIKLLDALVLVEADPTIVWARIQQDEVLRDRELFSRDATDESKQAQLASYIAATRQKFEHLAKTFRKHHFILTHNDDDIDRAARQLANFIDTSQA